MPVISLVHGLRTTFVYGSVSMFQLSLTRRAARASALAGFENTFFSSKVKFAELASGLSDGSCRKSFANELILRALSLASKFDSTINNSRAPAPMASIGEGSSFVTPEITTRPAQIVFENRVSTKFLGKGPDGRLSQGYSLLNRWKLSVYSCHLPQKHH